MELDSRRPDLREELEGGRGLALWRGGMVGSGLVAGKGLKDQEEKFPSEKGKGRRRLDPEPLFAIPQRKPLLSLVLSAFTYKSLKHDFVAAT